MTGRVLFEGVRLVDARKDFTGALLVEDGRIAGISESPDGGSLKSALGAEDRIERCDGLCLMPAFTDLHFHMRYPGQPEKETMETGERAAVRGGYTTLCTMANTRPVCDSPEVFREIEREHARVGLCDLFQISAVTKKLEGREFVDLDAMGALTGLFSDDGMTLADPLIMERALRESERRNFLLMTHCEPESEIVQRDLALMASAKGRLHVCHISRRKTVELIRSGKAAFGGRLTCEVTPHHLFAWGLDYRVNPPFGTKDDRRALIEAVKEGLVDAVGTDHAPHSALDKAQGSPGISGVETAFQVVNTVFKQEGIGLACLVRMMAETPARMLGLDKGRLEVGFDADLVLADLSAKTVIHAGAFASKGKNTPFDGWETEGAVVATMKRGEMLYDHRQTAR